MKLLANYLNEALIKKSTKIKHNSDKKITQIAEEIFEYLYIDKKYKNEAIQPIINWIIENNITDFEYVTNAETLHSLILSKSKNEVDFENYIWNYDKVDDCNAKLTHCDNIYTFHRTSDLYVYNDMLAHIFEYGTIYCLKK